jgi:hypothetical protein
VTGYPLDALREELAFLAYYLHWPAEELLALEHGERRRWVAEVSRINDELTRAARAD